MRTCPKCSYTRQPTDTAPDYECPQCGIIYDKYEPDQQARLDAARQRLRARQNIEKSSAFGPKPELAQTVEPARAPELESGPATGPVPSAEILISAILVAIGCFAPLIHAPIVGSISATQLQFSDGYVILALTAVAIAFTYGQKMKAVVVCGALSFLIVIADVVMAFQRVIEAKSALAGGATNNMFGGLMVAMSQSVSLGWGWIPLILGCIGIIATGMGYRSKLSITVSVKS